MFTKKTLGAYKIAIAAIVGVALVVQYLHGVASNPNFNPINFFSFFTIESNILAAVIFALSGALELAGKNNKHLTMLRGAATLYMTVTGIVYATLLSGLEESLQTPIPWVNFVLHYLFPFVAFADWLLDRPKVRVGFKQSLVWLLFPVMYLAYSLTRGALVGWYPYPFLDPANGGYGQVVVVCAAIAIGALGMCALFARLSGKK